MSSKKTIMLIAALLLLVLMGGFIIYGDKQMKQESSAPTAVNAESAVRDLVTEFGNHLKNVPLTASPDMLQEIIRTEYGSFVTPELLERWQADAREAPGRRTSSPWPERIDIQSVEKSGDRYIVQGTVVLMTSEEVTHGGNAGTEEVTLTLEPQGNVWLVAAYEKK